jgi:hypothetical protein
MISGLQGALNHLPLTLTMKLTSFDITQINKIIHAYHQQFGNNLWTGNGFKITSYQCLVA